ncbi:MAG TPA: zinc ABC transporter substrate-binding protein [Prolixibacteraceae bacterium]|nr:zinc ABC transporter substrate-binding protein [Prolixibacteraceae bacterium]
MRNVALFVSAVLMVLLAFSADAIEKNKNQKPVVSVSILPQKYFVEQISGDFLKVNVILPPGSSPEDYEPTPKQLIDVSGSKFFFYVGHLGFERTWLNKLIDVAPKVSYVSCSKGIDLLEEGNIHDSGEPTPKSHNYGTDPHIWTSPENVKKMCRTICSQLSVAYPAQKKTFESNLTTFIAKVDTLDTHIRSVLNDSINTSFMIYHPALGYYARDYHLIQYPLEYDGKEPSTSHMKQLVDVARKKNIHTILIQSQFETSKAQVIAKEIGAQIVPIDPLAENWLAEMYSLTDKMKVALAKKGR